MNVRNSTDKSIGVIGGLAMFAPSACGGAYTFLVATGSIGNRLLDALFVAIVVLPGVYLGLFLLSLVIAGALLQEPDIAESLKQLPVVHALAGMFLFTFVWILWQADKHSVVREIAGCVETASQSTSQSTGAVIDGNAVIVCYEELRAR